MYQAEAHGCHNQPAPRRPQYRRESFLQQHADSTCFSLFHTHLCLAKLFSVLIIGCFDAFLLSITGTTRRVAAAHETATLRVRRPSSAVAYYEAAARVMFKASIYRSPVPAAARFSANFPPKKSLAFQTGGCACSPTSKPTRKTKRAALAAESKSKGWPMLSLGV